MKRINTDVETTAYRGYLIRWSIFTLDKPDNRFWVERDGFHICWAKTLEEAKRSIDDKAPEHLKVIWLEAWAVRSAKPGDRVELAYQKTGRGYEWVVAEVLANDPLADDRT